jgi:hypothetical protein
MNKRGNNEGGKNGGDKLVGDDPVRVKAPDRLNDRAEQYFLDMDIAPLFNDPPLETLCLCPLCGGRGELSEVKVAENTSPTAVVNLADGKTSEGQTWSEIEPGGECMACEGSGLNHKACDCDYDCEMAETCVWSKRIRGDYGNIGKN